MIKADDAIYDYFRWGFDYIKASLTLREYQGVIDIADFDSLTIAFIMDYDDLAALSSRQLALRILHICVQKSGMDSNLSRCYSVVRPTSGRCKNVI